MRRVIPGLLLVLALPACGDDLLGIGSDEVAGSGNIVIESRDVTGFEEVVLAGEGALTVTFGGTESLTIEVDDNLLPHIETTVEDGSLVIRTESGIDLEPSTEIDYRVGALALSGVELSGVGAIDVAPWETSQASVVMSGVGAVSISELTARTLSAELNGVGTISVAGAVDSQEVMADGVGDYQAFDLRSATGDIVAKGTGVVQVWATERLVASALALGRVEYYGPAEIFPSVEPLASLTYLGDK